jgi:hypothetical protein
MSRHLLLMLLCLLLPAASAVRAAEEKPAGAPSDADLRLDLSGIGLPVLRDGRVVNFVFVRARIQLNPGLSRPEIEAREPFIREGLVRSAYRTPMNSGTDFMALDPARFEAVLMREAKAALGANKVRSVTLMDQKAQKRIYVPPARTGGPAATIRP